MTTELSDLDLFRELKGPELDRLRQQAEEVQLEADSVIFQEGDTADAFYLVLAGKVSIYRGQVGRPTERLATLTPGDFFGEMGLLAEATRNASIELPVIDEHPVDDKFLVQVQQQSVHKQI